MRILIRTSKWAIWSRRLAGLAVPLVIIPVLLHRQRLLDSDVFLIVAVAAGAIAALAAAVSLLALGRLWQSGDHGWGKAISALLLSLACLLPFGYVGALMLHYPAVTDISTAGRESLPLVSKPNEGQGSSVRQLNPTELEANFPNVKTRTYPLNTQQVFLIVLQMAEGRGWDIRLKREPATMLDAGTINAQIETLLGWRDEVVLRVHGDASAASVDMRSASLNARHDLGANGTRVEQFLIDLDGAITDLLRDNPNANLPVEGDQETPVVGAEPAVSG